jgi:hypothetical protein
LFAQSNNVKESGRSDVSVNRRSSRSRPRRTIRSSKSQRPNTVRQMLQKQRENVHGESTPKVNAAVKQNRPETSTVTSGESLNDDVAQLVHDVMAVADDWSVSSFEFESLMQFTDDQLPNMELHEVILREL